MQKKINVAECQNFITIFIYDAFINGDFEIPCNISEVECFKNKDMGEKRIEELIEKYNLKLIFETVQLGEKFQTYESRN